MNKKVITIYGITLKIDGEDMKKKASRGIITVFVTMIMVPVVAFTGTMVDVARLKLYSSQAAMAADTYGEMALSEYDNLLKELYGLFAVTQNEDGLQAIEDYAKYINYSFNPSGDGVVTKGFMPYQSAAVNVSYAVLENSALSETNILMTQISEFMKFRVVQSVLEQTWIIDSLTKFENMSTEMEVVEARNNITEASTGILTKVQEYYELLERIAAYSDYQTTKKESYDTYAKNLKEIAGSTDYQKYADYLENKEVIDAAKQRVEEAKAAVAAYEAQLASQPSADTTGETTDGTETTTTVPTPPPGPDPEDEKLAAQYVDAGAYVSSLHQLLKNDSLDNDGDKIKFGDVEGVIRDLDGVARALDTELQSLSENIATLNAKLDSCSDENLKQGIKEEIGMLSEIAEMSEDFMATVQLFHDNANADQDWRNLQLWVVETEKMKEQKQSLIDGKGLTGEFVTYIVYEWYDFEMYNAEANEFYQALKKFCTEGSSVNSNKGTKEEAETKINDAKDVNTEKIEDVNNEDPPPNLRDIPSSVSKDLKDSGSKAEIPGLGDFVMGGTDFSTMATGALDKFLVAEYAYGMFSSRVTGVDPEADEDSGEGSDDYVDESLTGVEMSEDINYLYGAELEYLIAGYDESEKNLDYTRNCIWGIRMTMNFISTYTIDEIDDTISEISRLVSDAVLATGIGAPAAALIRVALSGALRLGVAGMETYYDWEDLKARKKVLFYKSELDDMTAYTEVQEFLESYGESLGGAPSEDGEGGDDEGFAMSYEDYVFVLMVLFTNSDNLVGRTANLITLNVNQSQNDGDELSSLDFKMSEAYTAVESSCDVNLKFVIVPDNFVNMFMSSDTKALIQKLDNGGYGYSVIRGY